MSLDISIQKTPTHFFLHLGNIAWMGLAVSSEVLKEKVQNELGIYFLHPLFSQNQIGSSCCCVMSKPLYDNLISSNLWWSGAGNQPIFNEPPLDPNFKEAQQNGVNVIIHIVRKDTQNENLLARPGVYFFEKEGNKSPSGGSLMDYIKELSYINRTGFGDEEAHLLFSSIFQLNEMYHNVKSIDRAFITQVLDLLKVSFVNINETGSIETKGSNPYRVYRSEKYIEDAYLHPNLLAPIKIIETEQSFYIIHNYHNYNLETVFRFSDRVIDTNTKKLFLTYQVLKYLHFLHQQGIQCSLRLNDAILPLKENRENITRQWLIGELSNFDYLVKLNEWAGRRHGDPNFHPVFPWVIDFTSPTSWRDLTKSKFRLTKGDEQLDITYRIAKDGDSPSHGIRSSTKSNISSVQYHINDILSELTYYNYFARKTPIPILKKFVRNNYHAKEYPINMERLYAWTPDESIPEFYTDPSIFKSTHDDMPDLMVPDWADGDVLKFLEMHRQALESDHVSENLHHWIDVTFGHKLSGEAGIRAKNVALMDRHTQRNHGFVQLFVLPHPQKRVKPEVVPPSQIKLKQQDVKVESKKSLFVEQRDALIQLFRNKTQQQELEVTGSSQAEDHVPQKFNFIDVSDDVDSLLSQSPSDPSMIPFSAFTKSREPNSQGTWKSLKVGNQRDISFIDDLVYKEQVEKFSIKTDHLDPIYFAPFHPSVLNNDSWTPQETFIILQSGDLFSLGCIIYQLFTGVPLFDRQSIGSFIHTDTWWHVPSLKISSYSVRTMIFQLLIPCKKYCIPLEEDMSHHTLMQDQDIIMNILNSSENVQSTLTDGSLHALDVFPQYFTTISSFLSRYHFLKNWKEKSAHALFYLPLLSNLPQSGFDLVLPFYINFFQCEETIVESLSFVDSLASRLGSEKSVQVLLGPLTSLYERIDDNVLYSELLSIRFLKILRQRFGLKLFLQHFIKYPLQSIRVKNDIIASQASKAIIGLIEILGISLYMRHVIHPLLVLMTKPNSDRLMDTLTEMGSQVDSNIVAKLYIPTLLDLLQKQIQKGDTTSYLRSNSILKLIEKIIPFMSSAQISQCLLKDYSYLIVLVKSPPKDKDVFLSLLDCLLVIKKHIQIRVASEYIGYGLQSFYQMYESLNKKDSLNSEMDTDPIYNAQMAYFVGRTFKDILEAYHEKDTSSPTIPRKLPDSPTAEPQSSSKRNEVPDWTILSLNIQNTTAQQTLKWSFKGDLIHTYKDQVSGIRSLGVHESERVFAVGYKDNSIKCWDILSESARQTYQLHRQIPFSICFIDKTNAVASCDSTIHIWDIEKNRRYRFLEHPASYHCHHDYLDGRSILAGTGIPTVKYIDLRSNNDALDWQLPGFQGGIPKALCPYGEHLMAVGQSSGHITIIDTRSGLLLYSWKAHESGIIDIKLYPDNPGKLISSSQDKTICLWDVSTLADTGAKMVTQFGGHRDPWISFDVYKDELLSISGNKLSSSSLTQTGYVKLEKKKLLKTSLKLNQLTTANVLKNHQLLLVGTDDGQLKVIQ